MRVVTSSQSPTSLWFLVAFFPTAFFYHILVGRGFITPVLGGYVVFASIVFLPLLAWSYLLAYSRHEARWFDAWFFGFCALNLIIAAATLASGKNLGIAVPHIGAVCQFLAIFIAVKLADPSNTTFQWVMRAAFLSMSLIIFLLSNEYGYFVLAIPSVLKQKIEVASYQYVAIFYICTLLYAILELKSKRWIVIYLAISIFSLYFNGARSEFVAAVIACLVLAIMTTRRADVTVLVLSVSMLLGGLAFWFAAQHLSLGRISLLFTSALDRSVTERTDLLSAGIATIYEHPFLGDYGSYEPGKYIHNILSAWVDLGLIGFIWILAIIFFPFWILLSNYNRYRSDRTYKACLVAHIIVILLSFTSKSYMYPLIAVAAGLFSRHLTIAERNKMPASQPVTAGLPS